MNLSVCMIVKDEELVLERCLNCVCKFADEIIIVDTGSCDKSVDIAKKYTDKVYEIIWEDSFSKARNFSYTKATCDYVMWVDADDVLYDEYVCKIKNLMKNLTDDVDVINFIYSNEDDTGLGTYILRDRIIKRSLDPKWEHDIHEAISIKSNWNILNCTDIVIYHKKEKENAKDRNIQIYEKILKEGKKLDSFDLSNYCKELVGHKKYSEAISCYETLKRSYKSSSELNYGLYFATIAFLESNMYKECLNEIDDMQKIMPSSSYFEYIKGICYEKLKMLDKAIAQFDKAMKTSDNVENFTIQSKGYNDYYPLLGKSRIELSNGNFDLSQFYVDEASNLYPDDEEWKLQKLKTFL